MDFLDAWITDKPVKSIQVADYAGLPHYAPGTSGVPEFGPDFIEHARRTLPKNTTEEQISCFVDNLYRKALFEPIVISVRVGQQFVPVHLIPGHVWNGDYYGPVQPCSVMVIGKNPGKKEVAYLRNFFGDTSNLFVDKLISVGFSTQEIDSWYVTNVCRHDTSFLTSAVLPRRSIKNFLPLLHQEIRLVRPAYVLCLGNEAIDVLVKMTGVTITEKTGTPYKGKVLLNVRDSQPIYHEFVFIGCIHPAAIARSPQRLPQLLQDLKSFRNVMTGAPNDAVKRDHRIVYSLPELQKVVDEVIADHARSGQLTQPIAIDCEWHGRYWLHSQLPRKTIYNNPNFRVNPSKEETESWLISFQFSHKPGFGCVVVLRHSGRRDRDGNDLVGTPAFSPNVSSAFSEIKRLLTSTPERQVRLVGHNLKADIPWLYQADLELGRLLLKMLEAPADETDENRNVVSWGWQKFRHYGGFDTMYAWHAVNETAEKKLEAVAQLILGTPRYDIDVQKDKKEVCRYFGISASQLEGYGELNPEILHKYAAYDVDVTRELYDRFVQPGGLLDKDVFGNSSWFPCWLSQSKLAAELEMEMTGLLVDKDRARSLSEIYEKKRQQLLSEIRELLNWPDFNPNSVFHTRAALYGADLSGKMLAETGQLQDPRGSYANQARTFQLIPIKTSGKPARDWEVVVQEGRIGQYWPSTDKETIGILLSRAPRYCPEAVELLTKLRWFRYVNKVITSVLCTAEEISVDENDELVFERGFMKEVQADNRVRTRFLPVETRRVSSSEPNIQNISKRREKDFQAILGEDYRWSLRSIVKCPKDHVIVEADFIGAELMMMAVQSGSTKMVDHCQRANLSPKDPQYYDIHSSMAVAAFDLRVPSGIDKKSGKTYAELLNRKVGDPLPANKESLKLVGKENLRDVAKCVVAGTKICTTAGYIAVEKLCRGLDEDQARIKNSRIALITPRGEKPIISVYRGGVKPCYRVQLLSGISLTVSENHKFLVFEDGEVKWRAAKDLRADDLVIVYKPNPGDFRFFSISLPKNLRRKYRNYIPFPKKVCEDFIRAVAVLTACGFMDSNKFFVYLPDRFDVDDSFMVENINCFLKYFGKLFSLKSCSRPKSDSLFQKINVNSDSITVGRYWYFSSENRTIFSILKDCDFVCEKEDSKSLYVTKIPYFVFQWPENFRILYISIVLDLLHEINMFRVIFRESIPYFIAYTGFYSYKFAQDFGLLLTMSGVNGTVRKFLIVNGFSRHRFVAYYYWFISQETNRLFKKLVCQRPCLRDAIEKSIETANETKQKAIKNCPDVVTTRTYGKEHFDKIIGLIDDKDIRYRQDNFFVLKNDDDNPDNFSFGINKLVSANDVIARKILHGEPQLADPLMRLVDSERVQVSSVRFVDRVEDQEVFDVETTDPHAVVYNTAVTHQTIVFGLPYGRGDNAIIRTVEETGTTIDKETIETIRNKIFGSYGELQPFFARCRQRVHHPGWISNCFGGYRRFITTGASKETLAEMERQAGNFPIQGGVADALSTALRNFYTYPGRETKSGVKKYRLCAQIHDALMFYVMLDYLEWFIHEVLPDCMSRRVPVWHCDLNGRRYSGKDPYFMDYELSLFENWGEKIPEERCKSLGISHLVHRS